MAIRSPFDLSVGEAAAYLRVHPQTLTDWADQGLVPCWRTRGGHRRFAKKDLDVILATRPDEATG